MTVRSLGTAPAAIAIACYVAADWTRIGDKGCGPRQPSVARLDARGEQELLTDLTPENWSI
jgi:hypothetical protein